MSITDKFLSFMKLNDEDDYDDYEEIVDDEDIEEIIDEVNENYLNDNEQALQNVRFSCKKNEID